MNFNLNENPQVHLDGLNQRFRDQAVVKDAKKGFIRAEKFNYMPSAENLYAASVVWAYLFQGQQIDAVVGLPYAGGRVVGATNILLGADILPATREPAAAAKYNHRVEYTNESFTRDVVMPSYIGEVKPGLRVLLIDDVIAEAKTMSAAMLALLAAGAEVVGAVAMFEKGFQGGSEKVYQQTGIRPVSLIGVDAIENNQVVMRPTFQLEHPVAK